MRVISPVSLPTYLSVVYRNNMSAVPASIHLKTNVDRIYLLLLKTVLSFPSLLSKTMSIFQDFFKTFLQFSQIQDYFQDLNEFINFKTFSSLEENVRTMAIISNPARAMKKEIEVWNLKYAEMYNHIMVSVSFEYIG